MDYAQIDYEEEIMLVAELLAGGAQMIDTDVHDLRKAAWELARLRSEVKDLHAELGRTA